MHQIGFESHARHQNVLDFSRKEVVDYIYEMIAKVIRESSISYIKWDMNRYMSEPYSKGSAPCEQGKVMHKISSLEFMIYIPD